MNGKKPEILLVDDDPIILTILTNYLRNAGYSICTAKNGKEAWELLQKSTHRFSLLILDRVMPELDGIDLLYKIKMTAALNHIPIIMLTSHAERQEVGVAVAAGVYDFLYKPIEQDLLLMVVKRALESRDILV